MDKMKMKEELKRGIEAANQLKILLTKSRGKEQNVKEALKEQKNHHSAMIVKSFDTALSMVRNAQYFAGDPWNLNTKAFYNSSGSTRPVTITTDLKEDAYAWRKYGQKPIVNAKHPREYYRCVHRGQGCQATKKVQVIADNPIRYKIVYYGQHTCQNYQTLGDDSHQLDAYEIDSQHMLSFSASRQQEMKVIQEEKKPSKPEDQYVKSSPDLTVTAINQPQETSLHLDMHAISSTWYANVTSPHFVEENKNYFMTGCDDQLDDELLEIQLWD